MNHNEAVKKSFMKKYDAFYIDEILRENVEKYGGAMFFK